MCVTTSGGWHIGNIVGQPIENVLHLHRLMAITSPPSHILPSLPYNMFCTIMLTDYYVLVVK